MPMGNYDDEDVATATPPSDTKDEDAPTPDTALLPKSFFEGKALEPGKRCQVEIDHIYDDEVAVRYVPHTGDKAKAAADMGDEPTGDDTGGSGYE